MHADEPSGLSPQEEAVIESATKAVLDCVHGFDESVLAAIGNKLREVVPFDRLAVFVDEDDGRTFRILWRARGEGVPEAADMPTGTRLASSQPSDGPAAAAVSAQGPAPEVVPASPEVVADMRLESSPSARSA